MRLTRGPLELQELARKVRAARVARGLSTQQLADMIDLTSQQVRRYESGKAEPSAIVLMRIVRALEPPKVSDRCGDTLLYQLLDHVRSDAELADQLWTEHKLADKLPQSKSVDFKAKKAILQGMKLWKR